MPICPNCNMVNNLKPQCRKENALGGVLYIFAPNMSFKQRLLIPSLTYMQQFCRINFIKYELVDDAQELLYPFFEFNGERIDDLEVMEAELKQFFRIQPHEHEKTIAEKLFMVNYSLKPLFYRYKASNIIYLNDIFNELLIQSNTAVFSILNSYLVPGTTTFPMELETINQSIVGHLAIIVAHVKRKQFILGEKLTTVDIAIYSQLASVCALISDNDLSLAVRLYFPEVMEYLRRIEQEVYSDKFNIMAVD